MDFGLKNSDSFVTQLENPQIGLILTNDEICTLSTETRWFGDLCHDNK